MGKTALNRANRNFENYFVNRRYVKSKILSKAIEEGYQPYMMQHRYPFCVVHITVPPESVDVNVHPTKMEVRFSNQNSIYKLIADNISEFLSQQEMIPQATLGQDKKAKKRKRKNKRRPSLLKRNGGLQILLQMPQTSCARIPDITAAKMTRVSFLPAAMTMQRQKRSPFSSITVLQYSRKVLL